MRWLETSESLAAYGRRVKFRSRRCQRLNKTLWRSKAQRNRASTAREKKIILWSPMRRSFCPGESSAARLIRSTLCSYSPPIP
jgi:hypothetical protein